MRPVRTIIAVVFAAALAVTGCSAHTTADQPSAAPGATGDRRGRSADDRRLTPASPHPSGPARPPSH